MSKPSKNTLRSPLKERGVDGAIRSRYAEDKMIVDFHFTDSTILPDTENFSEKTVVYFVARSYYKSCQKLLKQVNKYKPSDRYRQMDDCAYRYLPAMFCFRHYLELKLKYLYMFYADESFNVNSHSLSELLEELKEKGFDGDVFDKPVAYVESLENSHGNGDLYFRYLLNKNLECPDSLEIPMFELSDIRQFITDIEHYAAQAQDKILRRRRMTGTRNLMLI